MSIIFDIETDGFYQDVTKIHCIALKEIGEKDVRLFGPDYIPEALKILQDTDQLIGHNIIQYDIPVIKKLYPEIKLTDNVLDTINLSMICFPEYPANQQSLEAWGNRLGFEKFNPMTGKEYTPEEWKERKKIKDKVWDHYTDEMGAYCKQDVRVTELVLWQCNIDRVLHIWQIRRPYGSHALPLPATRKNRPTVKRNLLSANWYQSHQ